MSQQYQKQKAKWKEEQKKEDIEMFEKMIDEEFEDIIIRLFGKRKGLRHKKIFFSVGNLRFFQNKLKQKLKEMI